MPGSKRISAANQSTAKDEEGVPRALGLMIDALKLLDRNRGPHDVCAHLDLAINRLKATLGKGRTPPNNKQ